MAIITIYQGASGSGEELAEAVAEALGYGCVSREVLIQASLRYGIPEIRLNEIAEKELPWWNRFLQNLDPYRLALQASFCEIAESNAIVYHGHLGHELLPDARHVLKVLLTAPIEMRAQQVQARQKLSAAAALATDEGHPESARQAGAVRAGHKAMLATRWSDKQHQR